jgi:hypothetical protein
MELYDRMVELEIKFEIIKKEIEAIRQEKYKRFRAEKGGGYFFKMSSNGTRRDQECGLKVDDYRYNSRNYFRTEREAELARGKDNIKYKIMDIAEELNDGKFIDWTDCKQGQRNINNDVIHNNLYQWRTVCQFTPEHIYCLSESFIDVVKERLTQEELDLYYKPSGEMS